MYENQQQQNEIKLNARRRARIRGSHHLLSNQKIDKNMFYNQEDYHKDYDYHVKDEPQLTKDNNNSGKVNIVDKIILKKKDFSLSDQQRYQITADIQNIANAKSAVIFDSDNKKNVKNYDSQPKETEFQLDEHQVKLNFSIDSSLSSNNDCRNSNHQITYSELFQQNQKLFFQPKIQNQQSQMERKNQYEDDVLRKQIQQMVKDQQIKYTLQCPQGMSCHQDEYRKLKSILPLNTNKKQFLFSPVPPDSILQTRILRINSGFNYIYPVFTMKFVINDTFILNLKKEEIAFGNCAYYAYNSQNKMDKKNDYYLGKIKLVKFGPCQTYNVYKAGFCAEDDDIHLVATITIMVFKHFRVIQMYILKDQNQLFKLTGYNKSQLNQMSLDNLYTFHDNRNHIIYLRSRKPQWVETHKEFYMDFKGKVKQASVKNFILEEVNTMKQVILFGKISQNTYHMDIIGPLSPFLAAAAMVPQFEKKN